MIQGKEYRICHTCEVMHFENCGTCLGFGVKEMIFGMTKNIPISAHDANLIRHDIPLMWDYCPECHSSPYGLPKGIVK